MNCCNRTDWEGCGSQSASISFPAAPGCYARRHRPLQQASIPVGQGPWKHFNLVFVAKPSTLSPTFGWQQKKHTSRLLRWRHSTTRARASTLLFTTIKDLSQFDKTCCDMQHFSPCPSPSLDIYRNWDSNTWLVLTSVSVRWELPEVFDEP